MCTITILLNKDPENKDLINRFMRVNIQKIADEPDGYSIYSPDRGVRHFLGTSAYSAQNITRALEYDGEDIQLVHSRKRSAGEDASFEGLHLKEIHKDVYYAHNGTINEFKLVKHNTDSFYFFKAYSLYCRGIFNHDTLVDYMSQVNFSGFGLIYEEKKKRLHVITRKKVTVLIYENFVAITTYEPATKGRDYHIDTMMGFSYKKEDQEADVGMLLHSYTIDDTYLLIEDGVLKQEEHVEYTVGRWQGVRWSTVPEKSKRLDVIIEKMLKEYGELDED